MKLRRVLRSSRTVVSALEEPAQPVEQLELLNTEVTRQLGSVAAKRTGLHTRGAILVTAGGLLASLHSTQVSASPWQYVTVGLSVAAVVLGLLVVRPRAGDDSNATLYVDERLDADAYSTEYSIVNDNIQTLRGAMARIEIMAKQLTVGYGILVLAWVSTLVIQALKDLGTI